MDTNVGLNFNFPVDSSKIIKVIGIGGGGVNSVNYMYNAGIQEVNFAVCNTDEQSFRGVDVPVKVTLGAGLGAGGNPDVAKQEFEKSITEVEKLLTDGTKMVFIATGMGGGTGSGAAPLMAKMAKSKGILTVGIVTIPFLFEMIPRIITALNAVEELNKNVDALIVINNERLKTFYPDYDVDEAFKKPNEVLAMSVKSITDIITQKGIINRDFNDVNSTMKDSGVALVSYGFGKGENRLENAIQEALNSPLLNNNDIYNAKRILCYVTYKKKTGFKTEEYQKTMTSFMSRFDKHIKTIPGLGSEETIEGDQEVKFTIIATGFGTDDIPDIDKYKAEAIAKKMEEEKKQREEDEDRVEKFYGENLNTNIKINRVSPSSIVILTMDEMDDDKFIQFMEEHPTYNRKKNEIASFRKPAKIVVPKEVPAEILENDDDSDTISMYF